MTAASFASLIGAKRIAKHKWVGRCPAHPDRHPSLSIGVGKRVPVVMMCMSNGCSTKDILNAMGLRWADLFDGKASAEVRDRIGNRERMDALRRRMDLVIWLGTVDRRKRNYWRAAYRGIREEWMRLRLLLEPEAVYEELSARRLQARICREGFEKLWEEQYGPWNVDNSHNRTEQPLGSGNRQPERPDRSAGCGGGQYARYSPWSVGPHRRTA